jgi:hypothetical protein
MQTKILAVSWLFLWPPVALIVRMRVHSPVKPFPFRVPHRLLAVRPVGRTDSPSSLVPTTVSLGLAPFEEVCPTPPRFRSQVFSTSQRFPSHPKLCGLVSCRNHSWNLPFRAFPSQGSRTPLGATYSLAVIHQCVGAYWPGFSPAGFADFHALTWLPGSPGGRSRLSECLSTPPGRPPT